MLTLRLLKVNGVLLPGTCSSASRNDAVTSTEPGSRYPRQAATTTIRWWDQYGYQGSSHQTRA